MIEIETFGDGQVHFDNFSLISTEGTPSGGGVGIAGLGHSTVAYGIYWSTNASLTQVYTTQISENTLPYMVETSGAISCNEGSVRIVTGYSRVSTTTIETVQCVLSHQQP